MTHSEISRDTLVDLYIVKNMTDLEIANQFSCHYWNIAQLRKKYGITGINARQREFLKRPTCTPLTDRQKAMLTGMLLGDGCLKRSGPRAYLSVAHSVKQKQYIEWIHHEFSSFCPNPIKEEIHHQKYTMYSLASETRDDLEHIRSTIYTPHKSVDISYFGQLNRLGLAVWYMDDGSLSYVNRKTLRYCLATNAFSESDQIILKQILYDNFGLESLLKPAKNQQFTIEIAASSFDQFTELVGEHVHPSMQYKLPGQQMVNAMATRMKFGINKELLRQMYDDDKLTQQQIAIKTGVSLSVVRKHMHLYGINKRNAVESQLGGKNSRLFRSPIGQFVERPLDKSEEQLANKLFEEIRAQGIDPKEIDSHHAIGIIDRLCGLPIILEEETPYCRTGVELCVSHFPHILNMAAKDSKSPIEIYRNDTLLMDCIRRTIRYAKRATLASVKQGLKTYKNNRSVTIFPPSWAKQAILSNTSKNNLKVLDFSCGFGGRMLGSYASGHVLRYVGIDPLEQNIAAHKKVNQLIQSHARLIGKTFETQFICGCAEDELNKVEETFDVVMTCPPYFDKEKYSSSSTQCYIRFGQYDDWVNQWLSPVLSAAMRKLNKDGLMIIFMSDYADHPAGSDCGKIMSEIFGKPAKTAKFVVPSLEYLRKPKFRKLETAWIAHKI